MCATTSNFNDDEIVRELVQPLEHEGIAPYGIVATIEAALAEIAAGDHGGARAEPQWEGGYTPSEDGSAHEIRV